MQRCQIPLSIDNLPRGGLGASWLDRRLQTNRLEFLDRDDVSYSVKKKVINALEKMGEEFQTNEGMAQLALEQVQDITRPRILELGSGHGGLSRAILLDHPTAELTITDLDPISVSNIAGSDLGSHPRASIRVEDATKLNAPDNSYDLVIFSHSFHHLPPAKAAAALAEGTRVGAKFLIIDIPRTAPAIALLFTLPILAALILVKERNFACPHDAVISGLRAYSPAAFRAMRAHVAEDIDVQLWQQSIGKAPMRNQIVLAQRRR